MRAKFATEDWWAGWLALPAAAGVDLLGGAVKTNVWLTPGQALAPFSQSYAGLPGVASPALTFLLLLVLGTLGAWARASTPAASSLPSPLSDPRRRGQPAQRRGSAARSVAL